MHPFPGTRKPFPLRCWTGKTREMFPIGRCDHHHSRMLNFVLTSWQNARDPPISHLPRLALFPQPVWPAAVHFHQPYWVENFSQGTQASVCSEGHLSWHNFCSSRPLCHACEKLLIWTEANKTFMGKREKNKKGSHWRRRNHFESNRR